MPVFVKYEGDETPKKYNKITHIENKENVIEINASNCNMKYLPDMNFPKLSSLNIDHNKLKSLPDSLIHNCPNLTHIILKNNQFKTLPDNMKCTKLIYFDCSYNILKKLPDIMNYPELEELKCSHNNLTSLPSNMKFPDLEHFDCSYNNLTSLPDNMKFTKLRYFDCSYNNLTSLPDNMEMPVLIYFYCDHNKLSSLPSNMKFPHLDHFNCSDNNLTSLPDNMKFPDLKYFYCYNNNLTSLPENMNFPDLEHFNCSYNNLTSLPENMNFPDLEHFNCSDNNLTSLPDNMNFTYLKYFNCSYNNLTSLPENMNFPDLEHFNCSYNNLTSLPDNMKFYNLKNFYFWHNKLTSLPLSLMRCKKLTYISNSDYSNDKTYYGLRINKNNIKLSPQIERFLRNVENKFYINHQINIRNNLSVYDDMQNVHNNSIQTSFKDSINNMTIRTDIPKYNIDDLIKMINSDDNLSSKTKEKLVEYCYDENIHSTLLLTFAEVLWSVLQTIQHDFDEEKQKEIKAILNQEMDDAEGKCFTGRLNRIVNCLNGFSSLVNVVIKGSDQINNVIFVIKNRLEKEKNYDIELHKEEVTKTLRELEYNEDTINAWVDAIEE